MANDLIGIYDHQTGEQITREMTKEEQIEFNAYRASLPKDEVNA